MTEPGTAEVLAQHRGPVLLITLNRPDRLNAWTPSMRRRYAELLGQAEVDPSVRAVVVTGSGRAFCAGTDITADLPGTGEQATHDQTPALHALAFPMRMRTPVIAAVNGAVAGAGLVAALFADVRFCSADARFTTAFSRASLLAEHGVAWLLPKIAGVGTAMDLLLSTRTFRGTEAAAFGLVDRALPGERLLDHALRYAHTLASAAAAHSCSPALDSAPEPAETGDAAG